MRSAGDYENVLELFAIVGLLLTLPAGAQPDNKTEFRQFPEPGVYQSAGRTIYVGIEAEPPDHPVAEYYDPGTRRVGRLDPVANHEYRDHGYSTTFRLNSPKVAVLEKRFITGQESQKLGASLWFTPGARRLPTIILIHGNESETRQMGFLIPYFVAHGLTVVTYDQRGTGESAGDWLSASPDAEADDALALIKAVESNPAVDAARIGLWGFSHGGWVAPIVATRYPVAFMILKSAASETIADNVLYEVEQDLREGNHFIPSQISDAVALVRMRFKPTRTGNRPARHWSTPSPNLGSLI
jgi:pimeloyl-ACP methyl ester carboxylesterase